MHRQPPDRSRIHLAIFEAPEQALAAVRALRGSGFEVVDVHAPFHVAGLEEALGLEETRLPWATLAGGALGLALALFLQIWTHSIDWPLNLGGKSTLALPALVPVAFGLTVLFAALSTVAALVIRVRLVPPRGAGAPSSQPHIRVTDDRFVLIVTERDAGFSMERFVDISQRAGAVDLVENWRVS